MAYLKLAFYLLLLKKDIKLDTFLRSLLLFKLVSSVSEWLAEGGRYPEFDLYWFDGFEPLVGRELSWQEAAANGTPWFCGGCWAEKMKDCD